MYISLSAAVFAAFSRHGSFFCLRSGARRIPAAVYGVFRHAEDRFSVDLESGRTVKFYRDRVSGQYMNDLLVFDVLALEDGREDHEYAQLSGACHHHGGDGAVRIAAVLIGGRHHPAAVVSAVHGRSQPCFLKGMRDAIHGDNGIFRRIVEEQPFDGDSGVVDLLAGGGFAQLVPDLAAVAVNAVSDTV